MKYRLIIRAYEKDPGDRLVDEVGFSDELTNEILYSLFGADSEEIRFSCWEISPNIATELKKYSQLCPFNMEKYDYFIESY